MIRIIIGCLIFVSKIDAAESSGRGIKFSQQIRLGSQLLHTNENLHHQYYKKQLKSGQFVYPYILEKAYLNKFYELGQKLYPEMNTIYRYITNEITQEKAELKLEDGNPFFKIAFTFLQKLFDSELNHDPQDIKKTLVEGKITKFSCSVCKQRASELQAYFSSPIDHVKWQNVLNFICWFGMTYAQCDGIMTRSVPPVGYSLSKFVFEPDFFCKEIINSCSHKTEFILDEPKDYVDRLMKTKPEHIKNNDFMNKLYQEPQSDKETIKFVQFTDAHLDKEYMVGSKTDCSYIICCRNDSSHKFNREDMLEAGYWGSFGEYGCDIPLRTFDSMVNFVADVIKPDVVLWTGDVVPHDIWNQSLDYVKLYMDELSRVFKGKFSKFSMYMILGNHDFEAMNSQDFEMKGGDRMLETSAEYWDQYLFEEGDVEARKLYEENGYYKKKLVVAGKRYEKVNMIGLNTQACYMLNWLLWKTRSDPGKQLDWLENQFLEMEQNGEVALLLGHVPPSKSDCSYQWSIRLRALIDRFQHIVRFQLHGHSHLENVQLVRSFDSKYFDPGSGEQFKIDQNQDEDEEFDLEFDDEDSEEDSKPVGVHYTSGSLTTFEQVYPTFRVFEMDAETFLPVKIHTYKFDIFDENPDWKLDHTLPEYYEMPDLSPASFYEHLAKRIAAGDEEFAMKFQNTKSNGGLERKIESCNLKCKISIFCEITNSVYTDQKRCQGLSFIDPIFDLLHAVTENMVGPWYKK